MKWQCPEGFSSQQLMIFPSFFFSVKNQNKTESAPFYGWFRDTLILLLLLYLLNIDDFSKSKPSKSKSITYFSLPNLQLFCAYRTASACGDWSSLGKNYFFDKIIVLRWRDSICPKHQQKISTNIFYLQESKNKCCTEILTYTWTQEYPKSVAKTRDKWTENWI